MGERGDPTRNRLPPGLCAMEMQGDGWRVAMAIRGTNGRFNWICRL